MNILGFLGKFFVDHWYRLRLFVALILTYFMVLVTLFIIQNQLIFLPEKIDQSYAKNMIHQYSNVEEIEMMTPDKVTLHGWFVKNTSFGKAPLLIYYGGNAEELSYLVPEAPKFEDVSLLFMNYRGYGLSKGTPSEGALCKDAEFVYDQIIKRPDIDQKKLVLLGRSIGSGVAVHMAGKRKIRGIILSTPYDSLISVVQERFKFLPASFILTTRFDSIAKAPKINVPLLALIAKDDEVIPSWHAIKLVNQWGGPKEVKIFEGVGHNTIQSDYLYWESIHEFLKRMIQ